MCVNQINCAIKVSYTYYKKQYAGGKNLKKFNSNHELNKLIF